MSSHLERALPVRLEQAFFLFACSHITLSEPVRLAQGSFAKLTIDRVPNTASRNIPKEISKKRSVPSFDFDLGLSTAFDFFETFFMGIRVRI